MKPDQLTQDLAMIARNAIDYIIKLERERDALLEALKYHQEQTRPIQKSIDAIAKAEEQK